ncbi:MAG: DUF423 domain-containing protein [Bacteroidota bacterium]|jgi:uncharacterized membrane protein YgdD (TMEM256/DUF423 family)
MNEKTPLNHIKWACLSGALAVSLGALGAHALKNVLDDVQIDAFKIASQYHFIHCIVIILAAILGLKKDFVDRKKLNWGLSMLWMGKLFFSFSIYLLVTRHLWHADWLVVLGPITPIGGIMMIIGWILMGLSVKTFRFNQQIEK